MVLVGTGVEVINQIQSSLLTELELDIEVMIMFVLITVTTPPGSVAVVTRLRVKLTGNPTGKLEFPPGSGDGTVKLLVDSDE